MIRATIFVLLLLAAALLVSSNVDFESNPDNLPVVNCRHGDFHWGLTVNGNPELREHCTLEWCNACQSTVCVKEEPH